MPGIDHLSIDGAVEEAGIAQSLGIPAVLLFGLPASKDAEGSGAWDDEGIIQLATRAIKSAHPDLLVITDLCLCEYTSHGHCGVLRPDGVVDNDQTLELLARTALSQAEAGADAVAPSDMMDGRVGALRAALDDHGLSETPLIAYSAKFASAFYGPFREAADSAPQSGDRKGYQMDPANALEAVREAKLDADEGADIVMVKPALPYLDVIRRVKDATGMPVAAYNVSGEYAMVKAAAAQGLLDERAAVLEALTGIRRAGRRHRDHLPRQGRRQVAVARAKVRSRRDGSAVPLDETDKKLLNLMQGSFALAAGPVQGRRGAGRDRRGGGHGAGPVPARQADHPRGHADLRHPRARLQLDAGRGQGRRRATRTGRRSSSTRIRASRTTTCATTTSTCGSRSRSSRTRSSASTARST